MTLETAGMLAGAGAFTAVAGANDGGSIVAIGRAVRGLNPVSCFVILVAATLATPLVLGTAVAETFTGRLVDLDAVGGRHDFLVAVLAVVAVMAALATMGLPTSITLALVGAIAGAGVGSGAAVRWEMVALVLVLAALAPVVGALVARLLVRVSERVPVPEGLPARVRWLHAVAFALMCVAYGANDGQKMLAVAAVAYAVPVQEAAASPLVLGLIAAGFLIGASAGYDRFARTLGGSVVAMAPERSVTAELAGASVVLGSSALGSPVSMTQAASGALVGAGAAISHQRVRWRVVTRLVGAWGVTLPVSLAVGALAARITSGGGP